MSHPEPGLFLAGKYNILLLFMEEMTRTIGHTGSRHATWKGHPSHSSNKLNKKNSHRIIRNEIKKLFKLNNPIDLVDTDIPTYNSKKIRKCASWY